MWLINRLLLALLFSLPFLFAPRCSEAETLQPPSLYQQDCESFARYIRQVKLMRDVYGYSEETLWHWISYYANGEWDVGEAILAREIVRRVYAGETLTAESYGC